MANFEVTHVFQPPYPFKTGGTKAGKKEADKARDFLNWLMDPKPLKEIAKAEGKTTTTMTKTTRPISGVAGMAKSGKVITAAAAEKALHGPSSEYGKKGCSKRGASGDK